MISRPTMNFNQKLTLYSQWDWLVDYGAFGLSWFIFLYYWVFMLESFRYAMLRAGPVFIVLELLVLARKNWIMYKLTGIRPKWLNSVVTAGVQLCPECGYPLEVQQTTDGVTITKIEENCSVCPYKANITVLGSNEEYADINTINNFTA